MTLFWRLECRTFYRNLSNFIGNLRKQEFDGVENKIKNTLVEMATDLTSLLLQIRLEKISKSDDLELGNLLDEEKFILDSQEEQSEANRHDSFCNN